MNVLIMAGSGVLETLPFFGGCISAYIVVVVTAIAAFQTACGRDQTAVRAAGNP